MGLFSRIFNPKPISENESIIKLLKEWEQKHFPSSGYRYDAYRNKRIETSRYEVYRSETGETIQLSKIKVPLEKKLNTKRIFEIVKDLLELEIKPQLPYLILQYRNDVATEIQRFKANLIKLGNLSDALKKDNLFVDIEHLFNAKLKVLHNELLFCKFQNLGNATYFETIYRKLVLLKNDMQTLNTNFSEYMYALSRTEYKDNQHDLERIRISVEEMSKVVDQYIKL